MKIGTGSAARRGPFRRVFFLAALAAVGCFGGEEELTIPRPAIEWTPATYVAFFVDSGLVLDGLIEDSAWGLAAWTSDFVDIRGAAMPAPRYRTRVKMLWDSEYFYIAAAIDDPQVWANVTQRDAVIYQDNDFEVFIDPDGDTQNYYELEINALGTHWDLMLLKPYRDGGPAINSWDIAGLVAAVNVNGTINDPADVDQGWTVEIAIPWVVLGEAATQSAPPLNGDQWRVNFSRVEWQTTVENSGYVKLFDPTTGQNVAEDNWVWSPQGLVAMHYPEMWGVVQFSGQPVGSATETVLISDAEKVRHSLYQIYFEQRDWFARHGRYARSLSELGFLDLAFPDWESPPGFEVTLDQYQVTRRGPDGWEAHITEDGRSWVEHK